MTQDYPARISSVLCKPPRLLAREENLLSSSDARAAKHGRSNPSEHRKDAGGEGWLFSLNETMTPRLSSMIVPPCATNLPVDLTSGHDNPRARSPRSRRESSWIESISPRFLRSPSRPLSFSGAGNQPRPRRDSPGYNFILGLADANWRIVP